MRPAPDTQITVKPVIDLAEHLHVDAYEAPGRLKAQTELRDLHCVFPYCTRPADRTATTTTASPTHDGGPTCSCNTAPCCRGHHRAKTTSAWSYVTVEPGSYVWTSPQGYDYLGDETGTRDVSPDDRTPHAGHTSSVAHFGQQTRTTRPHTPLNEQHRAGKKGSVEEHVASGLDTVDGDRWVADVGPRLRSETQPIGHQGPRRPSRPWRSRQVDSPACGRRPVMRGCP